VGQKKTGLFLGVHNFAMVNNHLYSPHYGSSDSTKNQQKEKAEKIQ